MNRGMLRHGDHGRHRRKRDDRAEVLAWLEGQLAEYAGIDGEAAVDYQQGIAIRRAPCYQLRADIAAGAGPVVHHHGLPEAAPQFRADHPRQGIGAAARRKGHYQADRPLREVGAEVGIGAGIGPGRHACQRHPKQRDRREAAYDG